MAGDKAVRDADDGRCAGNYLCSFMCFPAMQPPARVRTEALARAADEAWEEAMLALSLKPF